MGITKRILSIFLILIISVSLVGCNNPDPLTDPDLNPPESIIGDVSIEKERSSKVYEVVKNRAYDYDLENSTSQEFAAFLALGWNLGNTLDATGGDGTDPIAQETSWGNPETTQMLIQTVADYGFTTIRIPITWDKFVDEKNQVDTEFLARVKQIVDWSLDEGLFVIINSHHDGEWLIPSEEKYDETSQKLCAIWEQVGTYFADYDERLVFEAMNEPRVGDDWNGNWKTQWIVNQLGLDFVSTIRGLGGNNSDRFLLVPCYAATSNSKVWERYQFPDDDRVILSVHGYMPYNFALNVNGTAEWNPDNPNDTRDIDNLFEAIDELLLKNGKAVVIGEFGVLNKSNLPDRIACVDYYSKKAAELNIPIFWWDNNAYTDGETFGLINRVTYECVYPEIVETMINNWYETDFSFEEKE